MNFLKKLGKTLAGVGAVAAEIQGIPFIGQILGAYAGGQGQLIVQKTLGDLNAIASIVVTAEAMFQTEGSGATKLAATSPLTQQIILQWAASTLPHGKAVKHPEKLASGASQITSGMADVLSAFED